MTDNINYKQNTCIKFYWHESQSYFGCLINSNICMFSCIGQQGYLIPRHVRIYIFLANWFYHALKRIMLIFYTRNTYQNICKIKYASCFSLISRIRVIFRAAGTSTVDSLRKREQLTREI